jgi:hypothetical protein
MVGEPSRRLGLAIIGPVVMGVPLAGAVLRLLTLGRRRGTDATRADDLSPS